MFNNIALAKKQSSVTVNDDVILREHEGVLVVIRLAALRDDGKRLSVSPREKLLTSFSSANPYLSQSVQTSRSKTPNIALRGYLPSAAIRNMRETNFSYFHA